ncbi:hypothetical protein [Paraburkholderia ferrariae]|nr:hypothetical protein [Paraburkholderia ferrariae]
MSYITEKGRIDHLIFYFYPPNLTLQAIFAGLFRCHCSAAR